MKTNHLAKSLITLFLLMSGAYSFAQIQTFEWQNVQRQYLVRTPSQYDDEIPVMFFLHGLGDNITRLDNEFRFQQIADQLGWAIVVPQALNEGYGTMWNAGLTASTTNDSGFLMALLDSLVQPYQLNTDSVFFTGFSMGGFMTHRMAIEHGDRIAACAPVSGLITTYMASHTAVAPVRMLHIHGTTDPVVGYDGGSDYFQSQLGLSVENILNYWKNANGCSVDPQIDTLPDLHNDGLRFVRYTFDCGTDLQHIKVIGGVHNWYMNENQYDISYMTEIVKFFKGTNTVTDVSDQHEANKIRIYPNPSKGLFTIDIEEATFVRIIDVTGQVVMMEYLTPGSHQMDLRALPGGIYIVRGGGNVSAKIVIER